MTVTLKKERKNSKNGPHNGVPVLKSALSRKYSHLNIDSFVEKVALRWSQRVSTNNFWELICSDWLNLDKGKKITQHIILGSLATSLGECGTNELHLNP